MSSRVRKKAEFRQLLATLKPPFSTRHSSSTSTVTSAPMRSDSTPLQERYGALCLRVSSGFLARAGATEGKVCLVEHSNGDGGVTLKPQARSPPSVRSNRPSRTGLSASRRDISADRLAQLMLFCYRYRKAISRSFFFLC